MADKRFVHYIFSTYKRRYVLTDPKVVLEISTWFRQISEEKGFKIIEHHILGDHVHILIEQNDEDTSKYIMRCIKGISSRFFFKKYPKLPRWVFRRLWQKSYKCWEIQQCDLQRTIEYIKNQKVYGIDKRFYREPTCLRSGLH